MINFKESIKTFEGQFRIIAFFEGISYLLLSITMVLKYQYSMKEPNFVVGLFHGLLFIMYMFYLSILFLKYNWNISKCTLSFVASLVPFGTFYAEKKIYSKQ